MKSMSFWALAVLPWLLEIIFGTRVFNTILGSTLWALIVLLILIRVQVRDLRLRAGLVRSVWGLSLVWFGLWLMNLHDSPQAHFGAGLPDLEAKVWIQLHVAFLTGGLAAVVTLLVASGLWVMQRSRLNSDSWHRRGHGGWQLPSLESLSRTSDLAARLALIFWSAGSLLAIITLAARKSESGLLKNLADGQLLGVGSFWALLILNFVVARKLGRDRSYQSYLGFSLTFLIAFVVWSLTKESGFHSPLRWLGP